jgi:hypothetical protein
MSNSTIKSIHQILLISVTLFETHRLGLIKILIFKNLILKIKSIFKKKKKQKTGVAEPPHWGWLATP